MNSVHEEQSSIKSNAFKNFVNSFGNDKKIYKKNRTSIIMNVAKPPIEEP